MKEIDLLRLAANDDIGWYQAARGLSYRWWMAEHDFAIVTRSAKKLVKAGLLQRNIGYASSQRGPVGLTFAGRRRLKELEAACTST